MTIPPETNPASIFTAPMAPWPGLLPYAHTKLILGSELFYFDAGAGEAESPCLLVHGLGDEADTWRSVLPALAAQRRVIALDLPGFGRSALPVKSANIPVYVNTLLALLDELQIQQATLIGHSMGAILSQQFALQYPHRTANLVLVSGGLAAGKTRLNPALLLFLVPCLGEWAYNNLRRDPEAAYKTLYPYYYNLDRLPQAERDFLYLRVNQRVWSAKQRQAFLTALRSLARWLPAQQAGLAQRLAACQTQTRIVWGAEDRVADARNGSELTRMLPAGTPLRLVPQAGHNLQQESPQEIIQMLNVTSQKEGGEAGCFRRAAHA